MAQITVLKVDTRCQKCKKKIFKAVSSLEGVDKIEVDTTKGTLTVTGNADPYEIIISTRKSGKHVDVVTIGQPPAKKKQDDPKKPPEKKTDQKPQTYMPHPYPEYPWWSTVHVHRLDEPNPACYIL